jgi:Clip-domain serine protease homolog masquerade
MIASADHATRMFRAEPNDLTFAFSLSFSLSDSVSRLRLLGLLDTITSTENSKDCPGVCVHALATLICYEVLEDIKCPTASMKCCVESNSPGE